MDHSPFLNSFGIFLIASATFAVNEPAAADTNSNEAGGVVFTYDKPIEGFEVKVFWRPYEAIAGHIVGPAIVEFRHEDPTKTFFFSNNRFGLPDSSPWAKTATLVDGYFAKTTQPHAVLEYVEPEITDHLPQVSFFFLDLDFDGAKELVMMEIANGQRFRSTYRVYQPGNPGLRSDEIASRPPFNLLDSASEIDLENRTIRVFNSGSAQETEVLVYKFDEEANRYRLQGGEGVVENPDGR